MTKLAVSCQILFPLRAELTICTTLACCSSLSRAERHQSGWVLSWTKTYLIWPWLGLNSAKMHKSAINFGFIKKEMQQKLNHNIFFSMCSHASMCLACDLYPMHVRVCLDKMCVCFWTQAHSHNVYVQCVPSYLHTCVIIYLYIVLHHVPVNTCVALFVKLSTCA